MAVTQLAEAAVLRSLTLSELCGGTMASGLSKYRMGAGAFALALPGAAMAQSASPTAPSRDQVNPISTPEVEPPPRLEVEGDIERAPCALADPSYAAIKISFRSADFNNLGPVSAATLRPAYASFIGGEHPISILCDIRDKAATLLRGKGYLAAVQVPVQKIENGAVRFEILYAKLTAVRVMGDAGPDARLLEKYLSRLITNEPFNRLTAERHLLMARDLPGYDVRLTLRPAGTVAGEMVGEVRVNHAPVFADINIQNLASRQTGRFGAQARVQFNGLTGHGDRTSFAAYSTADFQEQQVFQASHDVLIGSHGLRFGGRATYSVARPDLGAIAPDLRGVTYIAGLEASYPIVRSQAFSLSGAGGIELIRQRINSSGAPLSRDNLRIAYARLDGDAVDLKGVGPGGTIGWRFRGAVELRHGLDILHASPDCGKRPAFCRLPGIVAPSLFDADPTATLIRAQADIELRPHRRFTVTFSPRGQYSARPLSAFEQFSAGSYSVGRGFDPGTLVGDSGVGFQTEIRLDSFRLAKRTDIRVQPYAFADHAWTWNKGAAGNPDRLSALGGGARINWPGRMRLDLALAVPVNRIAGETRRRDPRLLATLTTSILPWRFR
jgi:hemolysin activation/secretion protein